jgi:predicted RND superfamily exporter protein
LFCIAFLAFISIYPASNIRTDFNLEGFYPQNDRVIEDYQLLEDEFGRDDNTIIIGFRSDSLFTVPVLQDLKELTNKFESIEYLNDVLSVWNAADILNDQGSLSFESYLDEDTYQTANLNTVRERLTNDPLLMGALINPAGSVTAIVLQIDEDQNTYSNRNIIIDQIDAVLSEYRGEYEFHISGIPYFRNQYVNLLNGEIVMYISISSVLIILLLWYLYRSVWGVLFPMIIVWITLLFTIALIELTGGYLEIMSSTIAPILLCVGVADAIHMISKYDDNRESGMEKKKSILEMLNTLGSATFLTSITTAIGFGTLLSSTVVPMQRFGIYTAVGVLLAFVITILFLPTALSLSGKKRVFDEKSGLLYLKLNKWLQTVSAVNRLHYRKVIGIGFLGTALMAIGIKNIDVNGKVFDDLGEESTLIQDSKFFTENLSPQFPMEFIINTHNPDGALSAALNERVDEFEKKLKEYPEIERVVGLHTLIKEIHGVMQSNGEQSLSELPKSDSSIAQYILLLEINEAEELYNFVDFDYQKLRVTAFTTDAGSKRINEIRDEINREIDSYFPDETVTVTGTTILSADLTDKIVYSLGWSILLAIIAITLIMALLFRNLKLVFIALIPNILPLVVVAGIMGYLNIDIKPSTAVIFTIALGIAVDDSIHYLARFRIEYLKRKAMFPSLAATTIRTGRAIIITSLILLAGFGTLISSEFTSTTMMGVLVCATIFSALIADLFILPSLFYWLKPKLTIS